MWEALDGAEKKVNFPILLFGCSKGDANRQKYQDEQAKMMTKYKDLVADWERRNPDLVKAEQEKRQERAQAAQAKQVCSSFFYYPSALLNVGETDGETRRKIEAA